MKVKPFPAPRVVAASVAQGRAILRGAWLILRRHYGGALLFFALALAGAALLWTHDRDILAAIHQLNGEQDAAARQVAWYLGLWGDFLTYNVPFVLLLWTYGAITKSSPLRRTAMVAFLGATLAGLCTDFLRLTAGRARPDAHVPDGFYGITHAFKGGFQSFPSGHAASDMGMAIALLAVNRPLGLITAAFALAVVWARMELERHFPSDVAVGSAIGILVGCLVGFGAKARGPIRFPAQDDSAPKK